MNKTIEEHHQELDATQTLSHKQGFITIVLIFGLFGIWSVFAQIETTITASGKIITQSYNKSVKSTRGGVVKEIFVKEGDLVKKDQPLLRLESINERAKLSSSVRKHDANIISICRLNEESKLSKQLNCDALKESLFDPTQFPLLMSEATMLFGSNIHSLDAKINLLKSQNRVSISQNSGLVDQLTSNKKLLASYKKELTKWKKLLKQDAVDELKAVDTQRKIIQTILQLDSIKSRIEENNATIESRKQEIVLAKEQFKNTALTKKNELTLDNKLNYESIIALKDTVESLTIKSPSDGLVTDMKIRSTGEVVTPQKQIISIVPNTKDLIIEAFVIPTDIEKLYKGQTTEISFPAFVDPSALPITGEITYISADILTPENSQESFYTIRIAFTKEGLEAIEHNKFKIVPGMPAAAFVHTGKRTLIAYLMNPVIQMFKGIFHAN